MQLKDKVIIVTGSTTGIGEAIARRVVKEGAKVLIHGRDKARGEQIVNRISAFLVFCVGLQIATTGLKHLMKEM